MPLRISLSIFIISTFLFGFSNCVEHIFHWNSSNVEFRHGRVNAEIDVRIGDTLRFVCPENSEDQKSPNNEYLKVYEVGELAFGECQVETLSREVLRCGMENNVEKILRSRGGDGFPVKNSKLSIRDITPVPNGREFSVGQTYYYITTSSGKIEGIDRKYSGLCETENMRLAIRILPSLPVSSTTTSNPRRQDYTKPSEDEDEDSINDKPSQSETNPKFRRPPSSFSSAGVHEQQFIKVAQMAKEGKTGTFENAKPIRNDLEMVPWKFEIIDESPVVEENLSYQREPDYLIHEENVQSLEYSSSSKSISMFISILVAIIFLF